MFKIHIVNRLTPLSNIIMDLVHLNKYRLNVRYVLLTIIRPQRSIKCSTYVDAAAIINNKYAASLPNATTDAVDNGDLETKLCLPSLKAFTVLLTQDLANNEHVALTGNTKALGEWQLEHCVPLARKNGTSEWSANVMLPSCVNTSYRYLVYVEDELGRKQIRRWETHLKPRQLSACLKNCTQVDIFGQVLPDVQQVNRGWLTHEKIVQLKFEREKMFQVHDINKFDPDNVYIKVEPLAKASNKLLLDSGKSGVNVEVAKLKYNDCKLRRQPALGIAHKRNDVVIFHITQPLDKDLDYNLLFYTEAQQLMGKAVIESEQLEESHGDLVLKIKDYNQTVIAHLTLPYLVVKPFSDIDWLDFRTTYAHYWPKSWPNLDVGHRGNGKSYIANPPKERENTISSFLKAYEVFADMVELDVHLTADGIPVIYHDFGVRTAPEGKVISDANQLEYVLLKDLTYEAIKKLRVFAIVNNEIKEYPSHDRETIIENRIFPTLLEVLQALPKTLGIDVEIKWPQRKIKGGIEAEQTIDKNFFIDRVLQVILQKGCGRPLIFSSFDADICTMLRFKQNLLPVMYLTQGETKKWEAFLDLRTRTFEQAINNAQAFELLGTAPHAEDFKGREGFELMKKARDLGQIALVWGDDCNSKEAVKYFQDIQATAICYDRSDLYVPATKTQSFFNSTTLMEEFKDQCRV